MAANLEIWKPVVGFEDLYEVSDCGRVRSVSYGILSPGVRRKTKTYWFSTVNLCDRKGHHKGCTIGPLVLEAHVCLRPSSDYDCHHIDGNPLNNNLSNLEWKLASEHKSEHMRGENSPAAVLTENDVIEIKRLLKAGSKMQCDIARQFKVYPSLITKIKQGKLWGHVRLNEPSVNDSPMENCNRSNGTDIGAIINNSK